MTRASLYFHTLRHLRPIQVRTQIARRLLPAGRARPRRVAPQLRAGLAAIPFIPEQRGAIGEDLSLCFLNVRRRSDEKAIDWAARDLPKLWRYNLHYFGYLLDPALSEASRRHLIADWALRNPPGTPDAWEPYPVSLRIVAWVKYFLQGLGRGEPPPREALASLHLQASWLERNLEYHLLANHLFKNAVALIFAGAMFADEDADRWLASGWRLLLSELREQFLPDGGHYERSPMYHALTLVDCLDVVALLGLEPVRRRVHAAASEGEALLRERATAAVQFLRDICLPDGEIPLFNDSAFGIAPSPSQIFAHARALGIETPESPRGDTFVVVEKPNSGYFGFRRGDDMLLIDCGAIGPDHQPGHAHCDTLSYELALGGARVIVDSGVFDYETGSHRKLCRSTLAHNTAVIDGCEQSEVWASFRVARRARPLGPRIHREAGRVIFEGAHDGYRRLPGRPVHRRRVTFDGARAIEVEDIIEGSGMHNVESRVRLHPDFVLVPESASAARIESRAGRVTARVQWLAGGMPDVERGKYFPEFGREQDCDVAVLRQSGPLPLRLAYRIVRES